MFGESGASGAGDTSMQWLLVLLLLMLVTSDNAPARALTDVEKISLVTVVVLVIVFLPRVFRYLRGSAV